MLDGQNMFFDSTTYNKGEEWRVDETLNQLIKDNKVEEMIVVGIYCLPKKYKLGYVDRYKEYSPYKEKRIGIEEPKGKEFADFLIYGIIPYIDEQYRTIPDRNNRAIMGSSMAGMYSLWLGYNYDSVFSMVGALSPSLWVNNRAIIQEITKEKKNLRIWIDIGTEEWREDGRNLVTRLKNLGYEYGIDLMYYEVQGAGHTNYEWSKRVQYPILMYKGNNYNTTKIVRIDVKDFYTPLREKLVVINPILEFDNGIMLSALDLASYQILDNEEIIINENGIIKTNKTTNMIVEVNYKEYKEIIEIK